MTRISLKKSKLISLNNTEQDSKIDKSLKFSFKNFDIRIIKDPDPLLKKAKSLRYKSFFINSKKVELDSDEYDALCDHLVVIDKSVGDDFVVGTYRLLLKEKKILKKNFYSETEFDISNLCKIKNISMLEAGRSCVHEDYRDGRIIKLLWRGLAYYIIKKKADLIFGCASFPSADHKNFIRQLSYLKYFHIPPQKYSTSPLDNVKANLRYLPVEKLQKKEDFRLLPPLIKAYIRVGAWIGEGAVVDNKFDTTDVLIILKSKNIIKKYSKLSFK